jgi:protein TonB
MKNLFLIVFSLFSLIGNGQNLPMLGCSDSDCDEIKLKELLSTTENALYDFYGFRYNDSLYLEVYPDGDTVSFKNLHFWVNEEALSYYTRILAAKIDYERLNREAFYPVIHVHQLASSIRDIPKADSLILPIPLEAEEFNSKGQRASYLYFYDVFLHQMLNEWEFKDLIEFELIMKQGKLAALNFITPPLKERRSFEFAQAIKAIERNHFKQGAFDGVKDYKITFQRIGYYRQDEDSRDSYLAQGLDYYVNRGLWRQLKQVLAHGHFAPEEPVEIDTSKGELELKQYQYLEKKLAENEIKNRWWQAIPTQAQIDKNLAAKAEVQSFSKVGQVPVFAGCKNKKSNDYRKKCFQQSIVEHIGTNFNFPEEALKNRIQGKIYITFVVEKDGAIDQIEVVRGTHPWLDLEGIRVMSEIPDCTRAASLNGEPVRMSFTMPINAKLK